MRRIVVALIGLFLASAPAHAQYIQQTGTVTPGHLSSWALSNILQDAGTATAGKINSLGIYGNGGTPFCLTNSSTPGPFTGSYSQLCAGISASAAYFNLQGYGGATALPLQFNINGVTAFTITGSGPSLPLTSSYIFVGNASNLSAAVPVSGDATMANTGALTVAKVNGVSPGTLYPLNYDANFTSAGGNLMLASVASGNVLGNNGVGSNEPTSTTVTSLLDRNFSSTQGSVLYRSGTGWAALTPGTSGQVLQTGGAGANPAWASIAGTGTVTSITAGKNLNGGTITSSGTISLSDTPALGTNGTTAGTLGLANGSASGATVTMQNPSATVAYNFNLPATAGTSGQVLTSAAGGTSPMTWTPVTTTAAANSIVKTGAGGTIDPSLISTAVPAIGANLNGQMSIPAASATGTFTATQVTVATTVGGSYYGLATYSQSINLATTGAGGMDTGTAPISGFISLYAIYGTGGTSILACAVATSSGAVYGGANMPAGYTYSALLAIVPTDASSHMKAGLLLGRKWMYQTYATIFTGNAAITTLTTQSISAGVPAAAKTASLLGATTAASTVLQFYASGDATGTGGSAVYILGVGTSNAIGGVTGIYSAYITKDIPLITAQTVFILLQSNGSANNLYVTDYTF